MAAAARESMRIPGRQLKHQVLDWLREDPFVAGLEQIRAVPARQVVNPLFGCFCHGEQRIKWRAVLAMGMVVASLADADLESARVVVRRLIWTLNDESGGIGWGAPEAMGEICARHERLAREYHRILISYIREDGNYLEHPILQRGSLWGVGRLAHARPSFATTVPLALPPFLSSGDTHHRGLAAHCAAALPLTDVLIAALEALCADESPLVLYHNAEPIPTTVARLAQAALTGAKKKANRLSG
jgi:hypothetical protein